MVTFHMTMMVMILIKTMIKKRVMTKGAEKIRDDIQTFSLGKNASLVTFYMTMMGMMMLKTIIKKRMMTKGEE